MTAAAVFLFLGVLATVLIEAYKAWIRRANPYAKPQPLEPPMPAPPAEHSRNDYDRKWDTALTQAIGDLIRGSEAPWDLVVIGMSGDPMGNYNGTWSKQLAMLGTDISAAKQMTASVTTGNPSLGVAAMHVYFGRAVLLCESDEQMADIQRVCSRGAHDILASYIAKRSDELAALAVQSPRNHTTLPVASKIVVNGASVMCFRSSAEAHEYLGALNGVYEKATAERRKAMALDIASMCQKGITTFRQPTGTKSDNE